MKQLLKMPIEAFFSALLYDKETHLMINLFVSEQRLPVDAPNEIVWNIQLFKPSDLEIEVETELMVDLKTMGFVSTPLTATTAETLIACLSHLDLPNFIPENISIRFTSLYVNGE